MDVPTLLKLGLDFIILFLYSLLVPCKVVFSAHYLNSVTFSLIFTLINIHILVAELKFLLPDSANEFFNWACMYYVYLSSSHGRIFCSLHTNSLSSFFILATFLNVSWMVGGVQVMSTSGSTRFVDGTTQGLMSILEEDFIELDDLVYPLLGIDQSG